MRAAILAKHHGRYVAPAVSGIPAYITPSPSSVSLSSGSPTQTIASQVFNVSDVLIGNPVYYTSDNPSVAYVNPTTGVITRESAGSTTVYATITQPPTYNQSGMLIKSTFDNGTVGNFDDIAPDSGSMSLIADPTGLLGGNVVKIIYTTASSGADSNHYLHKELSPAVAPSMGQSLWLRADYVFDANATTTALKKLFYPKLISSPGNGWITGGENNNVGYAYVVLRVNQFSGQLGVEWLYSPSTGGATGGNAACSLVPVPLTKYILEMEWRLNSTFTATDGAVNVYVNGALVISQTGLTFTDPLYSTCSTPWNSATSYGTGALVTYGGQVWSNMLDSGVSGPNLNHTPGTDSTWLVPDPTKIKMTQLAFGDQFQGVAATEYRYLKNVMASTQRIGYGTPTPGDV